MTNISYQIHSFQMSQNHSDTQPVTARKGHTHLCTHLCVQLMVEWLFLISSLIQFHDHKVENELFFKGLAMTDDWDEGASVVAMIEYFTHPSVVHIGNKIFANSITNVLIIMRAHMTRRDGLTLEATVESLITRDNNLRLFCRKTCYCHHAEQWMKTVIQQSGSTPEEYHYRN